MFLKFPFLTIELENPLSTLMPIMPKLMTILRKLLQCLLSVIYKKIHV